MVEDIKIFLRNFMSSWQVARIYETDHPKFKDSIEDVYGSLPAALDNKGELIIGIFGEEFASGEEIFFDLSKKMISGITNLKERGIERIVFRRDTTKEELIKFISFLIVSKEEITSDPQKHLSFLGVKNIAVGKIKVSVSDDGAQGEKFKGQHIHYGNCLNKLSQSLDSLVDEDVVNYLNLRFVVNNIMENLMGNYQMFFRLAKAKSHDAETFAHLLNVSILSIYFSYKLGFCRDDCLAIGTAALFHDIGKLYIGRKIIQKPGELEKEEFVKIKSHTVLGAEVLLRHVDTLTILPIVVAFEHHLWYKSGGYPKVSFLRRPHIASLIVSICDVYDALTQRRSYKRDYPPELIYNIMMREKGKKFDPKLLDSFFKTMGIWPIGTIVLLEDGRVAIVREENEDDIFLPKIEIVSAGSKEAVDLKEAKDVRIKHSLNPFGDGKKYLDLI